MLVDCAVLVECVYSLEYRNPVLNDGEIFFLEAIQVNRECYIGAARYKSACRRSKDIPMTTDLLSVGHDSATLSILRISSPATLRASEVDES